MRGGGGGTVFAVDDGDDVRERDVWLEGEVRGSRTDASQPGLTLVQLSQPGGALGDVNRKCCPRWPPHPLQSVKPL